MYSTILVALEATPQSRRVLPYAKQLADAAGARLVLVQVISDTAQREPARAQLAHVVEELNLSRVEIEVREGDIGPTILQLATDRGADLIAMATDRWADLDRWLNGSVVDYTLRTAAVPLLVVPPDCVDLQNRYVTPQILVPLDGSALSESALPEAAALAEVLGSKLLLFRAIEDAHVADPADAYLRHIAEQQHVATTTCLAYGDAESEIARASKDVEMIVMATHGRGGLARFLLGSVAAHVVQHAAAPVVLVHALPSATSDMDRTAVDEHAPFIIVG